MTQYSWASDAEELCVHPNPAWSNALEKAVCTFIAKAESVFVLLEANGHPLLTVD